MMLVNILLDKTSVVKIFGRLILIGVLILKVLWVFFFIVCL